ncbi:MAG: ABC transporter substrate-binding protein [Deltaproteobacteria bacterium]|nr:MAG: ABC transporter substrate-binding protein [Deltaproteobacteria bacterium]
MTDRIQHSPNFRLWRIIVLIVMLVTVIYPGWGASQSNARYGGKYNIPLSSEPESLDPAFITDIYSVTVANSLFDGLVEFDKDLNIVPAIAELWKISRNRRLYTFQLRQGVKFHNGREVTAEDFVFSFSRILQPDTHSPVASLFLNIEGAKAFHEGKNTEVKGLQALDRYTLKIELEQPFAPFLSILAMINAKVIPKEALDADFSRNPVGTGPFKFNNWNPGKEIILTANDAYNLGRPYLDTLYFQIYPNIEWEKVFADFERGFLDQSIIPSNRYDSITSGRRYQKRYNLVSKPTLNLVYIGMNCRQKPLDDVRVRQAMTMAVDITTIVTKITKRGSIPAKGILPPGIAGFDPEFQGYGYNRVRARKLLAEAGYQGGNGIPPLEIWTVSKAESVQKELMAYKNYLADIGIQIIPKVADSWKHFIKLINEKRVPLYYAAWYADYPDPDNFLYVLCHSKSRTNRMGYQNSEIDHLLESARQEVDYMKRIETYREVQKRVMEEAPLIAQHVNSFNYLFQPWVKGIEVSYLGAAYIPFRKIWIDYLEVAK